MESLEDKTADLEKADAAEEGEMSNSESFDDPSSSEGTEEPVSKRNKLAENSEGVAVEKSEDAVATTSKNVLPQDDSEASIVGRRSFKRIPIYIADYHNDVLEFIYRCLASRHLPLENNTLLHFDSHPDMVISRDLPASASYDKQTMLDKLSIENWIMPVCYTGQINRIIWVKNSWCNQMPLGKHNFKIGHKNDRICVDCDFDYFVSEGNYCQSSELEQVRDIELQVLNADTEDVPNPKEILSASDANYILDIDLDFFSTTNPFLEIYKHVNCYTHLSEIFYYESATESNVVDTTEKRKQQLDGLKGIFEHLEAKRTLEGLERPSTDIISQEIFEKIGKLVDLLHEFYADEEIDWLLIFDSGSTTDSDGLPHHISTEAELNLYFKQFQEFLQNLPHPPVLITMACSSEDDYCPRKQVPDIRGKVVEILKGVFGDKMHDKPILHNMNDDEWDIMKL